MDLKERKPKAYIAGPDGFAVPTKEFHDNFLIPKLEALGYEVLDPWKLTSEEEVMAVHSLPPGDDKDKRVLQLNDTIGDRNLERGIRPCNVIIANYDGVDVDSGTASEVAAGAMIGKTTFAIRTDFRLTGENLLAVVNVQVRKFTYMNGGGIFRSYEDLFAAAARYRDSYLISTA